MSKKAVCLISGGLDSCVATWVAKQEGYTLYAISFDYGQLHKRELASAKSIAEAAGVKDHIIFTVDLQRFGGSSLLDQKQPVPQNRSFQEIGKKGIPSTYVPARNTIFLSLALAWAETLDADAIFIGAHATDSSGYPDCRPEYIQAYQAMSNQATRRGVEGKPILIQAPLLQFTKTEIIKKGVGLKAPLGLTWSCYQGGRTACGRCDSCLLRLKGFQDIGIPDPLPYSTYPPWYTQKK